MTGMNPQVHALISVAARERAQEILRIKAVADRGDTPPLPVLLRDCGDNGRLYRIRVWQVTQAITGAGRTACMRIMENTIRWSGSPEIPPSKPNLHWLLDQRTKGRRLSAWIVATALWQGWKPTAPDMWLMTKTGD